MRVVDHAATSLHLLYRNATYRQHQKARMQSPLHAMRGYRFMQDGRIIPMARYPLSRSTSAEIVSKAMLNGHTHAIARVQVGAQGWSLRQVGT